MSDEPIKTYPVARAKADHSGRRWHVDYFLAYDGGGGEWTGYYRTLRGAKWAVWWNMYVRSWGGTAKIFDRAAYDGEKKPK